MTNDGGKDSLAVYEAILAVTSRMVQAAHNAEWDLLVELEHTCARLTEGLQRAPEQEPLSAEERQRKAGLIRAILSNDAAVRQVTEPWVARLEQLLGNINRGAQLTHAYQAEAA